MLAPEPALMQALEANGLDAASRLGKPEAKDLGVLAEHSPIYRWIVEAVEDDRSLAEVRDPHAGVGETKPHHIFNPRCQHYRGL